MLVGDAADFFDPFTGQGIYAALRGAELAAQCLIPALARGVSAGSDPGREPGVHDNSGPLPAVALTSYRHARRREFLGKWLLERLIGVGVGWPALTNRVVRRLARRPDLADLLVSATGNIIPARRVLRASVLAQFLW